MASVAAILRNLAVALWALCAPATLAAQPVMPATLMADRVEVTADGLLIAEGSVEIIHDGRILTAPRVVYDPVAGRIRIEGLARLTEGDAIALVASEADLDDELRSGILLGAELTLARALRIRADLAERERDLAAGITRTRLERAAASSCRVCGGGPPLWEVRAREVRHDTDSRRLRFADAQLRIAGLPVLWLPYLSVPDPSLRRAPGLLRPRLRNSTAVGTGIELGYFQPFGQSRDLTIYPFAGTGGAERLGWRYRQAFASGALQIDGAFGRDRRAPGLRGFANLTAQRPLSAGFVLNLGARAHAEGAILGNWGLSDAERLELEASTARVNAAGVTRLRALRWWTARSGGSGILRDGAAVADLDLRRQLRLPQGRGRIDAALRVSYDRTDTAVADSTALGRSAFSLNWHGDRILARGLVAAADVRLDADLYRVDPVAAAVYGVTRLRPAASAELRWPLVRAAQGHVDLIEPAVQIVLAPPFDDAGVPNRDSLVPELDRGNLLGFSRYPGIDRRETGQRVQFGLGLSRRFETGASREVVVGGILRPRHEALFAAPSTAEGWSPEWLAMARTDAADGRRLAGRVVIDADGAPARGDLVLAQSLDARRLGDFALSSGWTWAAADPDSPDLRLRTDVSNLSAQLSARFGAHWRADASGFFDVVAGEPTAGRLAMGYINECLRADLSFDTRFTAGDGLLESSEIAFSFELLGFGGSLGGPVRACRDAGSVTMDGAASDTIAR
jgi:LPS-assembly protein